MSNRNVKIYDADKPFGRQKLVEGEAGSNRTSFDVCRLPFVVETRSDKLQTIPNMRNQKASSYFCLDANLILSGLYARLTPARTCILTLLLIVLMFGLQANAQDIIYDIDYYDFINYTDNQLLLIEKNKTFGHIFSEIDRLLLKGDGQIKIAHIGDSHIQADFFSGRVRQRFQGFFQGALGGRGFIFPYSMANTNNPSNYSVSYTGKWEACRNVEKDRNCELGLSGISVTTKDSISTITVYLNIEGSPAYDFNIIKVYHNTDKTGFSVDIENPSKKKIERTDDSLGYTLFILDNFIKDTLKLKITKTGKNQEKFVLHGLSLETTDPGVLYHSIGVNGATAESFLRCNLFGTHLKTIDPEMVVVSLGTNEAYKEKFDTVSFESNYTELILRIKKALPGASILLTIPGDSYNNMREPNDNTEISRSIIFRIAEKNNCGVWDFYTIMGGLNSVYFWYKNGLAADDKLHLTRKGYQLQGDLFFNAFLKAYDRYIEKK